MDFTSVYGIYENQLLKAQQNQEAGTDIPFTVTVYLFLAKNKMSLFKTAKQRYTGIFFASLRYIERESAIESRTKRRGGYRYTVYCHGIPLSGDNTMSLFKIAKSVGVDFPPFYGTLNEISY